MVKPLVVFLLANLMVAGAPAPEAETPGEKDLKLMQGTWLLVTAEEDGKPSGKDTKGVKLEVKDKTLTIVEDGERKESGNFKLDAGKKPKQIDLTPTKEEATTIEGIYSVTAEELKICFMKGQKRTRPTELSSKGGYTLLVFKKMKP
jgi:uncharacterized protein (TIGR03067 family)